MLPARRAAGIRAATVVLTTLALITIAPSAVRASARDRIAGIQADIDAAADEYFSAQREAQRLDAAIAELQSRMRTADRVVASLQDEAAARAVELYTQAGMSSSVADLDSALDAGRQLAFMATTTEHATATIERYDAALRDSRGALADLEARKAEQARVLDELEQRQADLDDALDAARADLAAEQAAAAAARAEAAARAAAAAARNTAEQAAAPDPSDTGSGGTDPGDPTTPPPTSPPTSPPTTPPTTPPTPPPPPQPGQHPRHNDPFLSCVRYRESRGIYTAINPAGYYGAYQFLPSTWDATANHAGRFELMGVRPDRASPWDQDDLAWVLYQWQGTSPWGGHCP